MKGIDHKEGDIRVRRGDKYNFVTERYTKVTSREDDSFRFEWQTVGYHGENLRSAALFAIRQGAHGDNGAEIIAALKRAEKTVVESLKALKGEQ